MFNDRNRGPSDATMWRGLLCGVVVCVSICAAIFKSSTCNIFSDLFAAGYIVFGACMVVVIITLLGSIIDRVFLGNNDIDTPPKWRLWVCIATLVAVVFGVIVFL